jgi:hypothetical protein
MFVSSCYCSPLAADIFTWRPMHIFVKCAYMVLISTVKYLHDFYVTTCLVLKHYLLVTFSTNLFFCEPSLYNHQHSLFFIIVLMHVIFFLFFFPSMAWACSSPSSNVASGLLYSQILLYMFSKNCSYGCILIATRNTFC